MSPPAIGALEVVGSKRAPAMNPRPQNPDPFFSSKSQFPDDEYKYVQAFLAALDQRDARYGEAAKAAEQARLVYPCVMECYGAIYLGNLG